MNLSNATKLEAGYTMGVQPDGRELLVVVAKGTFTIPASGNEPKLADEQVPLVMTDEFSGEPGFSAPLSEIDYAPHKPKCDVLLNGSAYAPGEKPAERVTVSIRVGDWSKSFDVVGNRTWKAGLLQTSHTGPEPFTAMPISYNNAFGGIDKAKSDSESDQYCLDNHVGIGFNTHASPNDWQETPLPNTEETGRPITSPTGTYRPMALGPIGRAWQQRVQYAGTYDQNWLDNVFPFLPADFREEYYQAAPADQWIEYVQGGEQVELTNLTPSGSASFMLPTIRVPVDFFRKDGEQVSMIANNDTVVFEPDEGRFTISCRATLPLKKNIHEMSRVVVGSPPRSWYEDEGLLAPRSPGKRRFKSLDELVKSKQ